jgi:MATE family multidrug resistance protein
MNKFGELTENLLDDNSPLKGEEYGRSASARRRSRRRSSFYLDTGINYKFALYYLFRLAAPLILTLFFTALNDGINLWMASTYLGEDYIAILGIGSVYVNTLGYIFAVGIVRGMDTICSQAYGVKLFIILSTYFRVAKLILYVFTIVIGIPLILFSKEILSKFNIPVEFFAPVNDYIIAMIPYVILNTQFWCGFHFLYNMGITLQTTAIVITTSILHFIWCYFLVGFMGLQGIAIAMGITSVLNLILVELYIYYRNFKFNLSFSFDLIFEFDVIYDYVKTGIPTAIIYFADWYSYEIIVFFSIFLGSISLKASVILFTLHKFIYSFNYGLSLICTNLVGRTISELKVTSSKIYSYTSLASCFIIAIALSLLIYLLSGILPYIFTSDELVAQMTTYLLGYYVLLLPFHSVQSCLIGIVQGIGYQKVAYFLAFVIMYIVYIPFSLTLCYYVNTGIDGLWGSLLTCVLLICATFGLLILCVNWENISERVFANLTYKAKILHEKDECK